MLESLFDLATDPWVILGCLAIAVILVHEWRERNRLIESQRECEDELRRAMGEWGDELEVVWRAASVEPRRELRR